MSSVSLFGLWWVHRRVAFRPLLEGAGTEVVGRAVSSLNHGASLVVTEQRCFPILIAEQR